MNGTNTYSDCFFSDAITFQTVWIRKFEGNNSLKFEFRLDQQIDQWATVDFQSCLTIDEVDLANLTTGLIGQKVETYSAGYKQEGNRFWVIIDYVNHDMEEARLSFELRPYKHNAYPAFTVPNNV